MKFKTHSERNGSLMFTVFDSEAELREALASLSDADLAEDTVRIFMEDADVGWRLIAHSEWMIIHSEKGVIFSDDLHIWQKKTHPIWWTLSCQDNLENRYSRFFEV